MRPLWGAVLKVVVMATTMCSGIKLAVYHESSEDEGHEGERDRRPYLQDLNRAA
jgi:hypothetical protein